MGIRRISPTGRRVAVATAVLAAAGALAGAPSSTAEPTSAPVTEIACGGYDAGGDLLRPAAASITHASYEDGRLSVPATCGGYTDDGEFIGDD